MIPNGKGWHYITVKELPVLLRGITSKHPVDLWKVCQNKDFCNVGMPSEDNKILEFNKYQKFDKAPFKQILNV